MKMEFGTGMGRNLRVDEIAEHSKIAEQAGFSHLTFIDSQNLSRDVYSMMTIAAVNTNGRSTVTRLPMKIPAW